MTTGIVSAEGRDIGYGPYNDFIQIDAPTNQGSSGGPTFDLAGNVIGVNTALWRTPGAADFIGIAFAIPADTVKSIIAELKENGAVTRGWLGVEVEPVTPEIAVRSGLGRARGALVGAAKAANGALDVGDVITSLNGEPVRDFRALARLTAACGRAPPWKSAYCVVAKRKPWRCDWANCLTNRSTQPIPSAGPPRDEEASVALPAFVDEEARLRCRQRFSGAMGILQSATGRRGGPS